MSDFSVYAFSATFPSTLSFPAWVDPPLAADPTRLNVRADVQHRYAKVFTNGAASVLLEVHARIPSEDLPPDIDLGGRLFSWCVSMVPAGAPIPAVLTPVAGESSLAQVTISALYPGHYRINCMRPGAGGGVVSVALPFDVETTP